MSVIAFIGDEVSAAGYRLAGAKVFTPAPGAVGRTFDEARAASDVVIITAEAARHLPAAKLDAAEAAARPLLLIANDVRGRTPPPDVEDYVRATLGLEL